jgi:hypothetical protein
MLEYHLPSFDTAPMQLSIPFLPAKLQERPQHVMANNRFKRRGMATQKY